MLEEHTMSIEIIKHAVPNRRRRSSAGPPARVFLVTGRAMKHAVLVSPFGHRARAAIGPAYLAHIERLAEENTRPLRAGEAPLCSDDQVLDYVRSKIGEPVRIEEYVAEA
jgi:hypothetical protein